MVHLRFRYTPLPYFNERILGTVSDNALLIDLLIICNLNLRQHAVSHRININCTHYIGSEGLLPEYEKDNRSFTIIRPRDSGD